MPHIAVACQSSWRRRRGPHGADLPLEKSEAEQRGVDALWIRGDSHGLCAEGLASDLVLLGGGGTSSMGLSKSEAVGGVPAKGAVRPWSCPQFASRLH